MPVGSKALGKHGRYRRYCVGTVERATTIWMRRLAGRFRINLTVYMLSRVENDPKQSSAGIDKQDSLYLLSRN